MEKKETTYERLAILSIADVGAIHTLAKARASECKDEGEFDLQRYWKGIEQDCYCVLTDRISIICD